MVDSTYNEGLTELVDRDWTGDDIDVLLLDNADNPTFDPGDVTVADVLARSGNTECSGTGYEGRKDVPSRTVNKNGSSNRAELDHGNVLYSGADFGEIGAAIYYRLVTDDTDSPVWFYKDSGLPYQTNGTDFELSTSSSGLVHAQDQ